MRTCPCCIDGFLHESWVEGHCEWAVGSLIYDHCHTCSYVDLGVVIPLADFIAWFA